jgi:hypothetical protein
MKKSLLLVMALAMVFVLQGLSADKADVTGKWELRVQSPRGERTRDIEFKQDGESLTVIMQGRRGGTVEAKGSVKGNNIEWSVSRESRRGEFTMTYKGTIAGDSMKGEMDMGGRGPMTWSAKRKK